MNIKQILNRSIFELKKASIPSPELDAKILLREAVKKNNSFIYSHPEYLITNSQYSLFRSYIKRRTKGEPIAYILGHKEFFGLDFKVNKNVLIPRPETEWLVEKGMEFISEHKKERGLNVLEMGTGSGCVIVSLANGIKKEAKLFAADNSKKALQIGKKNKKINGAENIKFYFSDLFSNRFLHRKFDLIIANLPYVPRSAKNSTVKFEPKEAIFAGQNGTAVIKKFLVQAKGKVNENGMILLETDCRNAKDIYQFAKSEYLEAKIEIYKDLAGLDRYIEIRN